MSGISLYSCESETAKELKKGDFRIYNVKTPPTNVVLEDIHETDSDEVKQIKQIINELRIKLGNSTDLIKIEPETALFNILYTKNEIDQLMISKGEGFNLPLFLHSVLIVGAKLIRTRDGTNQTTEKYTELFSVAADNFEHIYKKFEDYDANIEEVDNLIDKVYIKVKSLTERTKELEDIVSKIHSCECDKEWMDFMHENFEPGLFDDEIKVNGNIDMAGNTIERIGNIKMPESTLQITAAKVHVASGTVEALNIPSYLTFIHDSRKEDLKDSVIEYNTYGVWQQACNLDVFGSVDVDDRLRINTLDENKRNVIKTVDVGATLDDLDYRVREIEQGGGGGGGSGYWKENPPRMERMPEHISLENFDFEKYANTITYKKISDEYSLIYFPNLVSIDLDYNRYQFITISNLQQTDSYITSKNGKLTLPYIKSLVFDEILEFNDSIHDVGIVWKNLQAKEKKSGVEFSVSTYARFDSTIYKGTPEDPAILYLEEFDGDGNLVLKTEFTLTHTVSKYPSGGIEYIYPDGKRKYIQCEEISKVGKVATYKCATFEPGVVRATLSIIERTLEEQTPEEFIATKLHTKEIVFKYTPERDILGNNDPPSITSTLLVDNETVIKAPNTMDFHKYGGVRDYEIRLDKLIIDDQTVAGFNKISFMDFEIGADYTGAIFTLYFGTSRFMMNNESIMKPISCYQENTNFYTDKLFKKDGYWTSEKVEVDCPCFLWDKLASQTLQDSYNTGEITIKYIPRRSQLSCQHDVICKEVFADNALSLYKSSTPCFYNPKLITDTTYEEIQGTRTEIIELEYEATIDAGTLREYSDMVPVEGYYTYLFLIQELEHLNSNLQPGDEIYFADKKITIVDSDFVKEPNDPNLYQYIITDFIDAESYRTWFQTTDAIIGLSERNSLIYLLKSSVEISKVVFKRTEERVVDSEPRIHNLYVIDFGYNETTEEFQNLPEGFRFRLTDPVFGYNYEAIKKNNSWEYTHGNLHYQLSGGKGIQTGNFFMGPSIVMNESNRLALKIMMQAINRPNVDGFENMWKTLWDYSEITVSKDTEGNDAFKKQDIETENGYCYYMYWFDENSNKFNLNEEYTINIKTKAHKVYEFDQEILNITFRWKCIQVHEPSTPDEPIPTKFIPINDCFDLLPFKYTRELDFEYTISPDGKYKHKGLKFYSSPDFLVWNSEIAYNQGTNTWRFLYDKDYVQIEPRPESCSALMTDKNIITDGIVVAQNLETHLHSLNQVANAGEELTQHVAYTDNILAEVIANLQNVNEFIRMTIITDFICMGISGLCSITKMGAAFAKGGTESALRFTEQPIIREVIQDGRVYNRIGSEYSELSSSGLNIITRAGEELSQEARIIRNEAEEVRVSANRLLFDIDEDLSLHASEGSWSFSGEDFEVLSTSFEVLSDGADLPAVRFERWNEARDAFMGWCQNIGQGLKNKFGIIFDSRNLINIGQKISDIFWLMIASEKAITWAIQIGTKINNCITFNLLDTEDKVQADFLFDKFNWHIVDKDGNKFEHIIKGIAKYNEPSGWDDEKLITGQALLENYYSKTEIDAKLAENNSNSSSSNKIEGEKFILKPYGYDTLLMQSTDKIYGGRFEIRDENNQHPFYIRHSPSNEGMHYTEIGMEDARIAFIEKLSPDTNFLSSISMYGTCRCTMSFPEVIIDGTLTQNSSQTITHKTNVLEGQSSIGTFCESTGKIYDGYDKIASTDCICQVKKSTTLNKRIVGIICSEDKFASHGDVLVKVNSTEGLEIGDILCPDSTGSARKATESELMFMMLHSIPMPKITSLETGIENTVATFIK